MSRIIFACVSAMVFLTAITGDWRLAAVTVATFVIAVVAYVLIARNQAARQVRAARVGNALVVLHTNNRWLLVMILMCLAAIWVSAKTPFGPPAIPNGIKEVTRDDAVVARIAEMEQRSVNKFLHHKEVTDKEMMPSAKPVTPPWAPSWQPWIIRWSATILLILLTIGYVPFAFADEMRAAILNVERRFRESGSATSDGLFQRITRRVFQVPVAAPAAAAAIGQAVQTVIKEPSWIRQIVTEFGAELFAGLFRRR